jgi:DNA topoisomerase-2
MSATTTTIKKVKVSKNTQEQDALSKQYQKKSDKEHVLDNPDTYIGSREKVDETLWVFSEGKPEGGGGNVEVSSETSSEVGSVSDANTSRFINKEIKYIPGLYKLFDEGVVNCRDHVIRMIQKSKTNPEDKTVKLVSYINIDVGADGTITMENDGNGIDVAKHPEYDIWIPQMIFGELRTSTNYDKDEKRIVGGKNGFGFKLVLIWSTEGRVETVDHVRGLKYVQNFKQNLDIIEAPEITKVKGAKPYTKVSFKPDYARFGIPCLTEDMIALFKKRAYDICAVTDQSEKKIKFSYNGVPIPVKNFQQYVDMYLKGSNVNKKIYECTDPRWEYAVALAPADEFTQISFVNGICTHKGGKHVEYVIGQIVRKLIAFIEKKKKVKVNASVIKEQIVLFLRCDIENPAFDSQTKDYMNTPSDKFGSTCSVSDAFIEKVAKMGVMDMACNLTEAKESRVAAKKTDGAKTKNIRGIENFMDANFSGTERSSECTLILCEGLSAMSGIVSGLSSTDRNVIGIYPLRGKLLNVRGESLKKITDNKEITDLKKILGLENGKEYTTAAALRYGKIMILCDQDTDGSHIKGLCINLFHCEWKSLTKIPGFISFMNTPILRASKAKTTLSFYNEGEYETWKNGLGADSASWKIKYFKGLGTSKSEEFKEYFSNKKTVDFVYEASKSDDNIDMVFNDKRANDRKTWLIEKYNKDAFLDTSRPQVSYCDFIDKELIHFSNYDCGRSIPCAVDGLKISLRKILFCAFKRRLTSEIKVAQFSGYVSEHSAYHHGEASLNGAIVGMAQNFVGSNNVNLLMPNGQFGTRLQGGDDSASERYIFTMLNSLTRYIFPEADDAILNYLNDDGTIVEPEHYVPIIPFALINGIKGIGTGFSCSVPPYNPADLITYMKGMLQGSQTTMDLVPFYEGFKGTVARIESDKYLIKGKYVRAGADTIEITELPVGRWTMAYTKMLEEMMDGSTDKTGKKIAPVIKEFVSLCTEVNVHFVITFPKGKLDEILSDKCADGNDGIDGIDGIEKLMKLTTTIKTSNIHMFDENCKLKKFEDVHELIRGYYPVRLAAYGKRKTYLVDEMQRRMLVLTNKARYIEFTLIDKIDLRRKNAEAVTKMLETHAFDKVDGDYKYLVKMPMDSVTIENVDRLRKERDDTQRELDVLIATTLEQMWMKELNDLEKEYGTYKTEREQLQQASNLEEKKTIKKKVVSKK